MKQDAPEKITRGNCAVITGAAGGFGRCFAERLARQGLNLILIDRLEPELKQWSEELSQKHSVSVEPVVFDLTDSTAVAEFAASLEHRSDIEFLINNVGFAHLRNFVDIDAEKHLEMVALHVTTPLRMTRAVLPGMLARNRGNIINLSSLGAWLPSGDAQYAATKSYLLVLSQSLHEELRGTKVRIQALCPSFVDTGFHNTAEMKRFPKQDIPSRWWMKPEQVIECSFKALKKNRAVVIPGWRNRLFSVGLRSPFVQPLIGRFFRPAGYQSQPQIAATESALAECSETKSSVSL